MTDYENLQKERPHIAAAVKRECSITTAFMVLLALDVQEREIHRLQAEIHKIDNPPRTDSDGGAEVYE